MNDKVSTALFGTVERIELRVVMVAADDQNLVKLRRHTSLSSKLCISIVSDVHCNHKSFYFKNKMIVFSSSPHKWWKRFRVIHALLFFVNTHSYLCAENVTQNLFPTVMTTINSLSSNNMIWWQYRIIINAVFERAKYCVISFDRKKNNNESLQWMPRDEKKYAANKCRQLF